jgi:HD-GYP domain-containing protein (c-di-GMP phosphodiesterase class II)
MHPAADQPSTEAVQNVDPAVPTARDAAATRFDRLCRRVRRAGLVWAQAEPSHVRWSMAGDYLTTLLAESPWVRRQVDDATQRWASGAPAEAEEAIPGCWLLPSGARPRCDGIARGVAIALTRKAVSSRGSLRALCQGASMDFELVRDLVLCEPAVPEREIPRLAAMVRLLRPVTLRRASLSGVETLLRAVEATHRCVRGHSERTAHLAGRLAAAAGMSHAEREQARLCGLLHDVGKLGVPEQVLRKPGALTPEERALVNMHPEIGQRLLTGVDGLDHTIPAVLWHHERWDGEGYPHRLSGERIPRMARLMAIVDSFDAMRSDRPYRDAMPIEHALAEIQKGAGRQFDPTLSQAFLRMVDREPALAA